MFLTRFSGVALTSLALASTVAAGPRAPQTPGATSVRFEFEMRRDAQLVPHSRVFLRAGGRRTLVFSGTEEFQTLPRSEFASRRVPRAALAACTGWFGGAGDNLYVVRHGARFDMFRQEMDEQAGPFPFRKLKSIRLGPRTR